jgi:hypothetical protein
MQSTGHVSIATCTSSSSASTSAPAHAQHTARGTRNVSTCTRTAHSTRHTQCQHNTTDRQAPAPPEPHRFITSDSRIAQSASNPAAKPHRPPGHELLLLSPGMTRARPYFDSSMRNAAGQARTHLPQPMQLTSSTNTCRGAGVWCHSR